jgi:hypothetical protein
MLTVQKRVSGKLSTMRFYFVGARSLVDLPIARRDHEWHDEKVRQ